jgi:hypothetical protein
MEPREYEPYFVDSHVTTKFTIKNLVVMDKELHVLFVENSPKLSMPNRVKITHVNPKCIVSFTPSKIKLQ